MHFFLTVQLKTEKFISKTLNKLLNGLLDDRNHKNKKTVILTEMTGTLLRNTHAQKLESFCTLCNT